jgi:hypothetical protein
MLPSATSGRVDSTEGTRLDGASTSCAITNATPMATTAYQPSYIVCPDVGARTKAASMPTVAAVPTMLTPTRAAGDSGRSSRSDRCPMTAARTAPINRAWARVSVP